MLPWNKKLKPLARRLRTNATPQENHLWYDFLRTYPIRFTRQKTILNFIADFYCHKARLVIEIDGAHHYSYEGMVYDAARTEELNTLGIKVIRFSNREVDRDFRNTCEKIDSIVRERMEG